MDKVSYRVNVNIHKKKKITKPFFKRLDFLKAQPIDQRNK